MSAVYEASSQRERMVFTKGAVERVLDLCTTVGIGECAEEMTAEIKDQVLSQMSMLADQGLRVLAIAQRTSTEAVQRDSEVPRDEIEKGLVLLGLVGLYDPPRLETKDAVRECMKAGIKVHMLTGEHPGTASAIAGEVGILPRNRYALRSKVGDSLVKTAAEFDGMTDQEIDVVPSLPVVIARCAPDTKTRMIYALHRRGGFVAMTGDGVNDAPSLKTADVGIAMGMAGSDVAKGASDMVLTDDDFASIVAAIEEGRRMFDNIQKFVLHLLVANVAEVILLIVGPAFQDQQGFSVFLCLRYRSSGSTCSRPPSPPSVSVARKRARTSWHAHHITTSAAFSPGRSWWTCSSTAPSWAYARSSPSSSSFTGPAGLFLAKTATAPTMTLAMSSSAPARPSLWRSHG